MKKKIALLLAAIMIAGVLPMNLFASTTSIVTSQKITDYARGSVFIDSYKKGSYQSRLSSNTIKTQYTTNNDNYALVDWPLGNNGTGGEVIVKLDTNENTGASIRSFEMSFDNFDPWYYISAGLLSNVAALEQNNNYGRGLVALTSSAANNPLALDAPVYTFLDNGAPVGGVSNVKADHLATDTYTLTNKYAAYAAYLINLISANEGANNTFTIMGSQFVAMLAATVGAGPGVALSAFTAFDYDMDGTPNAVNTVSGFFSYVKYMIAQARLEDTSTGAKAIYNGIRATVNGLITTANAPGNVFAANNIPYTITKTFVCDYFDLLVAELEGMTATTHEMSVIAGNMTDIAEFDWADFVLPTSMAQNNVLAHWSNPLDISLSNATLLISRVPAATITAAFGAGNAFQGAFVEVALLSLPPNQWTKAWTNAQIEADFWLINSSNYWSYAQRGTLPLNWANYAYPIEYFITDFYNGDNKMIVSYQGNFRSNDFFALPMVGYSLGTGQIVAKVNTNYGNTTVTPISLDVSVAGQTGVIASLIGSPAWMARHRIKLEGIKLDEKNLNALKDGWFTMTLNPSQKYHFVLNNDGQQISAKYVKPIQHTSGADTATSLPFQISADQKSISIKTEVADFFNTNQVKGYMELYNIIIAPDDPYAVDMGDYVEYKFLNGHFSDSTLPMAGVVPSSNWEKIAVRKDWFINYKALATITGYSGRTNQSGDGAKVEFSENTINSWWTEKVVRFYLTDAEGKVLNDVKISTVRVKSTSNVAQAISDKTYDYTNASSKSGNVTNLEHIYIHPDGHSFELFDLDKVNKFKTSGVEFWVTLSAQPNFEGDVYLWVDDGTRTLANLTAIDVDYGIQDNGLIKIASLQPVVDVAFEKSTVQIGYQIYEVADVTITERAKGAINKGTLTVSIGEYDTGERTPYMYFAPVTAKNIEIANAKTTKFQYNGFGLTSTSGTAGKVNSVKLDVTRTSDSSDAKFEPVVIKLKDLIINIDRTVPYGNYDIIVGGSAVCNNDNVALTTLEYTDKFFPDGRWVKDWFSLETAGANQPLTQRVVVTPDSNIAKIGETDYEMGVATFIDAETDRLMVPLRFVSIALGVEDKDIRWDDVSKTCTMYTAEKTFTFKANDIQMYINGNPFTLKNEDGSYVAPLIDAETERMFVPFRALGAALGVTVAWNDATSQAIYNPVAADTAAGAK